MKLLFIISLLFLSLAVTAQTSNEQYVTVTMKDYVDMKTELNKQHAETQFKNIQDGIAKATASMDKRLDGMNEFRDTLKDQAGTFITKSELLAWIGMLVGFFFAYSNWKKNTEPGSKSKVIESGDRIEVKK